MSKSAILVALGVAGVVALGFAIWVAVQRAEPKVEEHVATVSKAVYEAKKVLKDVETEDGKKVKAWVEEATPRTVEIQQTQQVIQELSYEQKSRLTIIIVGAALIGVFLLAVIAAWFRYHYRGMPVPQGIEDWLKYLISGTFGAVLGFLGSPAPLGDSLPKGGQAPAVQSKAAVVNDPDRHLVNFWR